MRIIFHILLLIPSITLFSQDTKKIEILNADQTFSNANKHPDYWRLIGNVSFKHNNTIMKCDSAYHYINSNKMQAFSSIHIKQENGITITGNILSYLGRKNQANIKGDVLIVDDYMILKTEEANYDLNKSIASYNQKGTIIDNEKTIKSKKGIYHSNTYKFNFTDSVRIIGKDYNILTENMKYNTNNEIAYFFGPSFIISQKTTIYCENGWYNTKTDIAQLSKNTYITNKQNLLRGDSLYYTKDNHYAKAFSNVQLIDTLEGTTIFGGTAEYFEIEEKIIITKKPTLEKIFEKDTLFMHARKFISHQKENNKKILAYNKVKFFKTNLQGKCDSLSYSFNDSIVKLFKKPILWSEAFQITADSLHFLINKGEISKMLLISNPMMISKEDSIDYNQIKGKHMIAYFKENKIQKIDVSGNGESIFVMKDEKKNEKIGLNYVTSTDLSMYFYNNKLNDVTYHIKPNSITTPSKDIKEEKRYLKGFIWRGQERPINKEDIFNE